VERLFPNRCDNDLSELTNGQLTPLSAQMYPKYYSNAPTGSVKSKKAIMDVTHNDYDLTI